MYGCTVYIYTDMHSPFVCIPPLPYLAILKQVQLGRHLDEVSVQCTHEYVLNLHMYVHVHKYMYMYVNRGTQLSITSDLSKYVHVHVGGCFTVQRFHCMSLHSHYITIVYMYMYNHVHSALKITERERRRNETPHAYDILSGLE